MKNIWPILILILVLSSISIAQDAKPAESKAADVKAPAAEIRLSETSALKVMAVSSEADKLNAQIQVLTLQLEKLNTQTIPALVDSIYTENKVSKDDYKLDLSHKCGDTPCMALVRNKTDTPKTP